MNLLLPIGRNSDGSDFQVAVDTHFFISHVQTNELYHVFDALLHLVAKQVSHIKTYVFCHSNFTKQTRFPSEVEYFCKNDPENSFVSTTAQFINLIHQALKKRERICEKAGVKAFQHLPVKKRPQQMLVLVDNIWDWIVSGNRRNNTAIKVLEILAKGPSMRIYCFFGSGLPYRNLLPQLIETNSRFREKLGATAKQLPGYPQVTFLGNQVVFTTDGLIYFKERGIQEFRGLY